MEPSEGTSNVYEYDTPSDSVQETEKRSETTDDGEGKKRRELLYRLEDPCPVYIGIVSGLQQLSESAITFIGLVRMIHDATCGRNDNLAIAKLLNAFLVVTGVSSVMEIAFGFRLPVMEGPSFSFLTPVLAMPTIDAYRCLPSCSETLNGTNYANGSYNTSVDCEDDAFETRMLEISGSLMCAGLFQTLLGAVGGVGVFVSFISSMTVSVTLVMLGIGIVGSVTVRASAYWPAALVPVVMYLLFSLVLDKVRIPAPAWNRKRGFHLEGVPIFRLFPSLLAILVGWLFCYILTVAGALTNDSEKRSYAARTDAMEGTLEQATWFFVPYPGHFGMPTFGVGLFIGFLGSMAASTFESLGDYYNTARACEVPPPPKHAVNRGIAVEGICSIFAGSIGGCLGTTTYSDVPGIIPVTGMASRIGWMLVGLVFIISGVMGKFTAAISLCPDPVIAGFNFISFGIVIAMGLSHLQNVDMKSVRNLLVLSVSIMLGIAVPQYATDHLDELDTGDESLNQVVQILLTSNMFMGGILTFILDNIIPGTPKERGLLSYLSSKRHTEEDHDDNAKQLDTAYGLPFITEWLKRHRAFAYIPVSPTFQENLFSGNCCGEGKKQGDSLKAADAAASISQIA